MNYKLLGIFLIIALTCSMSAYSYVQSQVDVSIPYVECPNCAARGDSLDPIGLETTGYGYSNGWTNYYCRNCGMQFAVYSKSIYNR